MWSHDTSENTRYLRALAQSSTWLSAIIIAFVWISIIFHLQVERSDAERGAILNSANLARAFEEHLSRTLNDIDRSLKLIRANYIVDESFNLKRWLRSTQLFDDQTLQVGLIGPDGFIKMSSVDSRSAVGTDLRDREHYRHFITAGNDGLFISKPIVGRTTGKWSIQLARRIERSDGSFAGVIVASLDPNYLSRFYSSVDIGEAGYIRIVGTDGIVRAVGGRTPEMIGQDLSSVTLFKHFPNQPAGWYYSNSVLTDHVPRLITYRAVRQCPLVVTIGLSSDEIFSGVYVDQWRCIFFGLALTTVIIIVNGFSIRARLVRDRIARDLNVQNLRFNALLADMPLGVCMFDCNGCLTVSNDRYLRMHGLPATSAISGTSVREIIQYSKVSGAFPGDVDSYCNELAETLGRGELVRHLTHLNDGRVIASLSQPIGDGGWISIYEDITEQQLAKVRLEQTRKFLNSIVENVPAPIVVKDPDKGTFVLVNHAYEKFMGLPRERLMGKTVFDVFPPTDAELIAKYDNEAIKFSKRVISAELSVVTPTNGSRIVTTTRLVVLDENDKPHYVIAMIDDVTEKRKAEARIAHMAHHDPVTGLLNRARFTERLEDTLACAGRNAHLAVLFIDLDHFKHVNDTLGHLIGDELLRAVADRLSGCIQEIDAVGRLGGDEFAIIQSAVAHPGDIIALVGRITAAIKAPYELGGFQTVVDVSIGIAQAPADATTSDELIKRADMALYRAKSDGRGTYRFFEPEMLARTATRRGLEASLRNSIVNGELELFYQPVVNIKEYRVVGLEALLRWRHPERGILSPLEFMGVAVETGLIVPLGEWVIRQACSDAASWPDHIKIAVNLSPAQFRSQNLAQVVINALATSGIAPSRLELEITEELLLGHNRDNLAVLEQLRKLGVQIVMDDFGIGYSSLNYLRLFPFDKIKIDRSFINEEDDLSLAIVQAVTNLARVLMVPATAEGIETREQLEFVRAAGCTEFQGYLFSPPKPTAEILAFLRRSSQVAANAA